MHDWTLSRRAALGSHILEGVSEVGPFQRTRLRLSASLRGKTLFSIFVVIVALMGGLYALGRVVLLRGFSNVEEDFARQNLERASSALLNELSTLDRNKPIDFAKLLQLVGYAVQ